MPRSVNDPSTVGVNAFEHEVLFAAGVKRLSTVRLSTVAECIQRLRNEAYAARGVSPRHAPALVPEAERNERAPGSEAASARIFLAN